MPRWLQHTYQTRLCLGHGRTCTGYAMSLVHLTSLLLSHGIGFETSQCYQLLWGQSTTPNRLCQGFNWAPAESTLEINRGARKLARTLFARIGAESGGIEAPRFGGGGGLGVRITNTNTCEVQENTIIHNWCQLQILF